MTQSHKKKKTSGGIRDKFAWVAFKLMMMNINFLTLVILYMFVFFFSKQIIPC